MTDNNRRKGPANDDYEFDWDAYDRQSNSSNTRRGSSDIARRRDTEGYSSHSRRDRTSTTKKKSPKKKKRTEKQQKRRKIIIRTLLVICLIGIIVGTGMSIGMYFAAYNEIEGMELENLAINQSSFIYYTDENGEAHELEQLQSEINRITVDSSQIPQVMKDAIVSIEDERFYSHHGVDLKRTIGATAKWALSKIGIGSSDYGGSTITQQVIKNITSEKENKASRKIKEIMRAIALEQRLSKDEILEMYLNIVYFAQNCWGVEAAANTYFNKTANELTLAEAASIAGITQYPALYDPIVNPEKNIEKRNIVLAKMLELGKITQNEYNVAVTSDLVTSDEYRQNRSNVTSYFADQVVADVIRDLQKKGIPEEIATRQVYSGGLKIYTTLDVDIQDTIESVYSDPRNLGIYPNSYDDEDQAYYKAQSAMVIVDPYTGAVKGLVGGLGEKKDIRGWNRATQAKRQPGSAFKPLAVYAPALDMGKITEMDVVLDEEIEIGNDKWKPKNSYEGFAGEMTIKDAVARSANIPAVKVLDKIGLSSSYGYLQNKFHIPLNEKDKNYSSLALGGLSDGVSPMDMAGAYAAFVNGGKYIEPYTYTQVVDPEGKIILANDPYGSAELEYVKDDEKYSVRNGRGVSQAISASAAYITSDLLYGVINSSRGTGQSAQLDVDMPEYGKTGTTDDDFDKWFVGFTPYYVGAVWFGFDSPASLTKAGISRNPSVIAWKKVMDEIHQYLPERKLEKPKNIVEVDVCRISGKLPKSSCDTTTAYFVSGTQPKRTCSSHYGNATSDYRNAEESPSPTSSAGTGGYSTISPSPTASSGTSSSGGTTGATSSGTGTSGSTGGGYSSGATRPNGQTSGSSSSGSGYTSGSTSGSSGGGAPAGGQTSDTGAGSDSTGGASTSGGSSGGSHSEIMPPDNSGGGSSSSGADSGSSSGESEGSGVEELEMN